MSRLLTIICALLLFPAFAMGQCQDCPECGNKIAVGFLKKSTSDVKTFKVERKEIAVPDICLPKPLFNWRKQICGLFARKCVPGVPCGDCEIEDCPKNVRGGKVRTIKVLSKKTVQCDTCSYKWEVTDMEKVDEYFYGPLPKVEETKAETKAETAAEAVQPHDAPELPKEPLLPRKPLQP